MNMGSETGKKGKLIGREVMWIKPSMWKRRYLMLVDGEQQAALTFDSWFTNQVSVYGLGQYWVFNRKGWFQQEVVTQDVDRATSTEPFRYRWTGGGTLYLDDGEELKFKHGFWGGTSYWETYQREKLIVFSKRSWWRSDTIVEFNPLAAHYTELPVLVFLGFYLRLLHEQDSGSTAAVTASV
jgi:hypothetical protein